MNLPSCRELAWYFGSVLALSAPLWMLGELSGAFILPGLPVSALSALVPAVAATIVVWRRRGYDGLQGFWGQLLARPRLRWIILAAAIPAVLACCSLAFMLAMGRNVPSPVVTTIGFIGLVAVFLPPAIGEEMGWSGFAAKALVARFGVVGGGLICGSFEMLWHLAPLMQAHRAPDWIAWWALGTMASRVVIYHLYERSAGSIHVPIAFHTMSNVSWMAFPVMGSHFDPQIHASLLLAFCAALTINSVRERRSEKRAE